MSEEQLSERTVSAPLLDQADIAAGVAPERDDTTYGSDERGLSEAANAITEARNARKPDRHYRAGETDELPTLRYESDDTSPLSIKQAAKDYTLSRDNAVIEARRADGEDVSAEIDAARRRSWHDEPADAPPAREIKLSDGDPELKELGRSVDPVKDGMTQQEALERLANLRQQDAEQRQAELEQLTEQQAEAYHATQEAEQEPEHVEQPQETAEQAAQREAHARHLAAEQARQQRVQQIFQAEQTAQAELAQLKQVAQQEFPDAVTLADVEQMKLANPARFQRLMQLDAAARQRMETLGKVEQAKVQATSEFQSQQRAQQGAQREAWNRKADEVANREIQKAIPHVAYNDIQKAARDMFREMGVDEAVIRRHWEGEPMQMRSPAIQTIISQAAMYRKMQAKAASVRENLKRIPPSQRPGTAGQVVATQDSTVTDLKKQIAGARGKKAMELGTKLLQAQRAARGNR